MSGSWNVLLVEEDADTRERLRRLLEHDGYHVVTCAGPALPAYRCPASAGLPCALAHAADVVVLDVPMESDTMMEGPQGWELLLYYLSFGKPVVALGAPRDAAGLAAGDDRVVTVPRHAADALLLPAVRSLLGRARAGDVSMLDAVSTARR